MKGKVTERWHIGGFGDEDTELEGTLVTRILINEFSTFSKPSSKYEFRFLTR